MIAAVLAVSCAVPAVPVNAAAYSDTAKTAYTDAVDALSEKGIIDGYPDGTFRPENTISRAEISKILSAIMLQSYDSDAAAEADEETQHTDITDASLMTSAATDFKDVSSDKWFAKYVGISNVCGIINGYPDNTFRPSGNITYNELSAMAVRACEYDMSEVTGAWPANYAAAAEKLNLYKGIKDFDPAEQGSEKASRGNAAIIINNAFSAIESAAKDGYTAARTAVPDSSDDEEEGQPVSDLNVKELSIEDAIEIMQTTGMLAETAAINKKTDQNQLKTYTENISAINSAIKAVNRAADAAAAQGGSLPLSTYESLNGTGTQKKMAEKFRDFTSDNLDNNYQAEMNSIEQTTRNLYYGVLQAQENVNVCNESVEIEKELLEIAKKKHDLDMLSDIALSSQEYSLTSAENQLVQAEQTLQSAQNSFNLLLDLPAGTELKLTTPLEKVDMELPSLQEAEDSMLANNLSLKLLELTSEVYQIQLDSMRYTVSTGSASYKQMQIAVEQINVGIEQKKNSMSTDMRTNYYNLSELENQISTFESTIALTEQSLDVKEVQYELGMTTISDVNQTKLTLLQAKQGLTNAIVTYNNAVSDFNFSMGVGTERISFSS
jgi:outer membrane protein TolC